MTSWYENLNHVYVYLFVWGSCTVYTLLWKSLTSAHRWTQTPPPFPDPFLTGSPRPTWGFTYTKRSRAVWYSCIHSEHRQSSKTSANIFFQGNRSRPISSFINQSTPLDLDWEQWHWNGTASISQLGGNAMAARAGKGLGLHRIGRAHMSDTLQQDGVKRDCQAPTSALVIAGKVPAG